VYISEFSRPVTQDIIRSIAEYEDRVLDSQPMYPPSQDHNPIPVTQNAVDAIPGSMWLRHSSGHDKLFCTIQTH